MCLSNKEFKSYELLKISVIKKVGGKELDCQRLDQSIKLKGEKKKE